MFKFLKKKHFFDEWKATSSVVSPFVPELGKIGEVKLGDRIDRLACMGRPHDYKQADKGRYSLEYPGLTVECEDGFLTYIGCMFGSVEVRTVDGRPVGSGLSVEQVMDLYGAPDKDDTEDADDIVFTYTRNGIVVEFEFGGWRGLLRVNCFRVDSTYNTAERIARPRRSAKRSP